MGDNRLMPAADYPCKVINCHNGFVRDNASWIVGRIVRDFETWMDNDDTIDGRDRDLLTHPIRKCVDGIKEKARDKETGEKPPRAGLCISIYRALEAEPGHPGYDGSYFAGFATGIIQMGLAAIPCGLFGDWSILLVTAVGIALSFASGALPQWTEEKWACRRKTKKTIALTRGNGSQHVIVILGEGKGLDLEDLAAADSAPFPSLLTRFATVVLAVLWILLLITSCGINDHIWYLLAIGGVGILDNIYVAGACRSPKEFGIILQYETVIGDRKVMKALEDVEEKYAGVGKSLLETFFPGDLRPDEQKRWDEYAERAKRKEAENKEEAKRKKKVEPAPNGVIGNHTELSSTSVVASSSMHQHMPNEEVDKSK